MDRYRSVSQLGNKNFEDSIQAELVRRFPTDRFPVSTGVVGLANATHAVVNITRLEDGINVSEKAIPEEFGFGMDAAVIGTVERILEALKETGRLSVSDNTDPDYVEVRVK